MADYDHGIIYLNDGFNDNTLKNIKEIANGNSNVKGFATIMCAILLLGGIQLLSIGVLGKYLEKTYIETKNRPIFIVKESNIDDL